MGTLPSEDPRHGTPRGYALGCRGTECREAKSAENRVQKQGRLQRPIPDHVHGTMNGYKNYDCPCDLCYLVQSKEGFEARAAPPKPVQW